MSAPTLSETIRLTQKSPIALPQPARRSAPPIQESGDVVSSERVLGVQDPLRRAAVRKEAVAAAIATYPDASAEELADLAGEIELTLLAKSDPDVVAKRSAAAAALMSEQENKDTLEAISVGFPVAGGVLGSVLSGGLLAPAMVGAGAGGVLQSLTRKVGFEAGVGDKNPGVVDALRNARNQATFEGAGFIAADKTLGAAARFFRGSQETAEAVTEAFRRVGIRPSLQDISDNALVEGVRAFLGNLPFGNRPFRRRAAETSGQVSTALDEFIEGVSPEVRQARQLRESGSDRELRQLNEDLSTGAFQAISRGFDVIRRERKTRFARMRSAAMDAERSTPGALRVQPDNTLGALGQIADEIADERILRANGEVVEDVAQINATNNFISDIGTNVVRTRMGFTELLRLKRRVSRQMETVKDFPMAFSRLEVLKGAIEDDIAVSASRSPDVLEAYTSANALSEEFFALLKSVSARKASRIQRGFGRETLQTVTDPETGQTLIKNAGPLDITQTLSLISRSGNPNEVRQFFNAMRQGVGQEEATRVIRIALADRLDEARRASEIVSPERAGSLSYTPGTFLRNLGLDGTDRGKFNAAIALFEASGVDPRLARDFATTIDSLYSVKNPNVAKLLLRQTSLGGIKTLMRSLTLGAISAGGTAVGGPGAGLSAAVATFVVVRTVGMMATSPRWARVVVTLADASRPGNQRIQAAFSLARDAALWRSEDPEEDAELRSSQKELEQLLSTKRGQEEFLRAFDALHRKGAPTGGSQ